MMSAPISLVQNSFARVFARKGELTERFYHHLFKNMPEAEGLFHGDFMVQKEMFATMLAASVRSLIDKGSFHDVGIALAESHARFNLTATQLQCAASSLMAALRDVMGDDLTPEEEGAWNEAVTRLAGMMVRPG
ncbi:globin domain-containing protein [Ruegeria sp. HKCCD8929]|uniref:globin domain-containing protein n=1 Tax=Ruegeria sp. HKCCD8929 TaxID=2683006 RepID=UPI0014899887|nr:globin domain-containing protein [Ruegeria sp. HKCCD8929]